MTKFEDAHNASRCPHEKDWYCQLLKKACHPGISGCILSGQPLVDALIAFESKEESAEKQKNVVSSGE